jgi:MFS transporter, putative metabolite:H+ symporter
LIPITLSTNGFSKRSLKSFDAGSVQMDLEPLDKRALSQPSLAGARLDRLPICAFHVRLLMLIGSGLFLDAFDIYMQGSVLADMTRTGWSNPVGNATFLSLTFAGLAIGTFVSGWLGDRLGRRTMYQANMLVFGLATLVGGFAPSFRVLLLCRFVCGLGLGGELITCYVTLAEFVPARQRGRWQGLLAFISTLGVPVSALVSLLVIPRFGWRAMFLAVGVLSIVAWLLQRGIPESPRWYEGQGRHAEAEEVLRQIEHAVEKRTGLLLQSPVCEDAPTAYSEPPSWKTLFVGRMLHRTMLAMTIMVCMNVVVYAVTGWVPTILVQRGFHIGNTLQITTLMQTGSLPGTVLGAWAADRWGRKSSLIVLSVLCGFMLLLYAFARIPATLVLSGFVLFILLYALTAMTFATYLPEIFPTRLRLTGCGISYGVGRLANVAAPFGVAGLLTATGPRAVFYAAAVILTMQALAVALFGEETRGRSLEEIEGIARMGPR